MTSTQEFVLWILAVIAVVIIALSGMLWGYTEQGRNHDRQDAHVAACTTIVDPTLRALCIDR